MTNIFMLLLAVNVLVFTAAPSFAQHDAHSHDNEIQINKPVNIEDIKVENGEVVVVVQGIVCSFCSQGVRKKLSKLPFVDSSRYTKGVKVEIENQKVTIAITEGSDFDIQAVFKSIKSGGYEPVIAYHNTGGEIITIKPGG